MQTHSQLEGVVLQHMRWKLLDMGQAVDAATASRIAFQSLVLLIIESLRQKAAVQDAGVWGHCRQILSTEVLYQLTTMYGLELELGTPHKRSEGWLATFLLDRCRASSFSELASVPSLCHDIALWYQVTVVSTEDTQEAMEKVEALRVGSVDSVQILGLFKGRFEVLQEHWIRFVHLFGLNAWPLYKQYKDVVDRFVDQETVVFQSRFMYLIHMSMDSSEFYSVVIASLPQMHWLKWQNISGMFLLSRFLRLLMFHEPSVCKGLLWYAPAILALDMSVTYLSHDLMVTGDLLFLLQLMVQVVIIHNADLHSLVHMLCINMPKKSRQKRKRGSQVELISIV